MAGWSHATGTRLAGLGNSECRHKAEGCGPVGEMLNFDLVRRRAVVSAKSILCRRPAGLCRSSGAAIASTALLEGVPRLDNGAVIQCAEAVGFGGFEQVPMQLGQREPRAHPRT